MALQPQVNTHMTYKEPRDLGNPIIQLPNGQQFDRDSLLAQARQQYAATRTRYNLIKIRQQRLKPQKIRLNKNNGIVAKNNPTQGNDHGSKDQQ